jgi:hypothetical protein
MNFIDREKHIERAKADCAAAIEEITETYHKSPILREIIDIAVEWFESNNSLAYSFFNDAFPAGRNATDFYYSLNSFLINCILDDSFYQVKWKRYVLNSGKFRKGREWIDNPYVVWSDERGTNKPELMLKAMRFAVEKEKQYLKDIEEWTND